MANFELVENISSLGVGVQIVETMLANFGVPFVKELDSALKEDDLFDRVQQKVSNGVTYKEALNVLSCDNNPVIANGAKSLRSFYDQYSPSISEYSLIVNNLTTRRWSFTDDNSGVIFFFELTKLDSRNPQWHCFADKQSFERYISKTLKKSLETDQSSALSGIVEKTVNRLLKEV